MNRNKLQNQTISLKNSLGNGDIQLDKLRKIQNMSIDAGDISDYRKMRISSLEPIPYISGVDHLGQIKTPTALSPKHKLENNQNVLGIFGRSKFSTPLENDGKLILKC